MYNDYYTANNNMGTAITIIQKKIIESDNAIDEHILESETWH